MDMDTTRGKHGHQEILEAFRRQEADILIGTQMIVKGHDFPNVTLVGVLAADLSLNASDFHSGERTFQLLTQAAGRAGRGEIPGNVVMQTYQPKHYSIVAAKEQNYEAFYEEEIAYRELMDYPPASHMLLILVTSEKEEDADLCAKELAETIENEASQVVCLGPSDAAVAKVNDIYKKVIYCKHQDYEQLISVKDRIMERIQQEQNFAKVMVWFDFDPMNQA